MYKQKLYTLLRALEVENIEELIEKPEIFLFSVGLKIAEAAKLGAKLNKPANKKRRYLDGYCLDCGKFADNCTCD